MLWPFLALGVAGMGCVWAAAGARLPPGLHLRFLLIAVLLVALAVILDAMRLRVLARIDERELRLGEAARMVLVYAFCSAITWSSLGGEASMVGMLRLRGLSAGAAGAVTGLRALLSVSALVLVSPLLALAGPVRFQGMLAAGAPVVAILCGGLLAASAALVLRRRLLGPDRARRGDATSHGSGTGDVISRAVRRLESAAWDCWMTVSSAVRARPGALLAAGLLTLGHLLALFSTVPVCAAALGVRVSFWESTTCAALVQLATLVIPAPGGGGVAETGLGIAMKDLLPVTTLLGTILLWRLVSCYSRVALGAALSIGVIREAAGRRFRNAR